MAAFVFALHILGAVVWVGGMFAIYVCLRPALVTLEPPQRLRLMRVTFQKFFPWVWTSILLLLASGYSMVFIVFGGFAGAGLHVHLMQGIGWLMIALFVWLFHGPWLAFKRAVEAADWPSAGTSLDRIRQIISINLPLGLSSSSAPVDACGANSQSNSLIEERLDSVIRRCRLDVRFARKRKRSGQLLANACIAASAHSRAPRGVSRRCGPLGVADRVLRP